VSLKLNDAEEREWNKWQPRVGDLVLIELAQQGVWPGKVGCKLALALTEDHREETVLSGTDHASRQSLLLRSDLLGYTRAVGWPQSRS
jgi:hypothetical protein